MIGGALGAAEGMALPHVFPGVWAMLGLAAVVVGVMRCPLTGTIFTLKLTHAWPVILPLLASTSAYAASALALKLSVLTEKIARRGLHLTREYSTDPLETLFVSDVIRVAMPTTWIIVPGGVRCASSCQRAVARRRRSRRSGRTSPQGCAGGFAQDQGQ